MQLTLDMKIHTLTFTHVHVIDVDLSRMFIKVSTHNHLKKTFHFDVFELMEN